jgi:hypothetical protein
MLCPMNLAESLERAFIWLSGASWEQLQACPAWERRKYVAFGATVLVPCSFAAMSCAYALSTLNSSWPVIAVVSAVWACIILAVDRALLATYRAHQAWWRKLCQFALRVGVAALMGATISHPLTLLLFRDTIGAEIERNREVEMQAVRNEGLKTRELIEGKMKAVDESVALRRKDWDATFQAQFLDANGKPIERPLTEDERKAKAEREAKLADAVAPAKLRLESVEKELAKTTEAAQKLAGELNFWQSEFERELNGQRSGIVGLGPRARSIQDDQLAWRRAESNRLNGLLSSLTRSRTQVLAEIKATEDGVVAALEARAAEVAAKARDEQARVEKLRQQVQQQQADAFVLQQNSLRETLRAQIDSLLEQKKSLQLDLQRQSADEAAQVDKIAQQPRRDILTQTLALHALFLRGAQGGHFALTAYIILGLLFMLVDTIPLVVKFFSKPGPYDCLQDVDEVKFSKERTVFLQGMDRYMKQLQDSPFLNLTQSRPLERALIEGVDRSRAAKAFLEHLMELEQAFQERMKLERERLETGAGSAVSAAMLEDMAAAFYADLRGRMESFFRDDRGSRRSSPLSA